jgi:hypothetical protein
MSAIPEVPCKEWLSQYGGRMCVHNLGVLGVCLCANKYPDPPQDNRFILDEDRFMADIEKIR